MGRFWVCLLPAVVLVLGLVLASRAVMNRESGADAKTTQTEQATQTEPVEAGAMD